MKLNLGCGYDIREGWINVDKVDNEGVDVIHDLDKFPYPFKDNVVDEIIMIHILEHLNKPKEVLDELWRISKPNARITIEVPHFSSWQAWGDITHKRTFNSTSLDSVRHDRRHINLLTKSKVNFIVKPFLRIKTFWRVFGFQWLINLHNATRCFYERNIAQIIPLETITWKLIVLKGEKWKKEN